MSPRSNLRCLHGVKNFHVRIPVTPSNLGVRHRRQRREPSKPGLRHQRVKGV
jgi:hypothetical protein